MPRLRLRHLTSWAFCVCFLAVSAIAANVSLSLSGDPMAVSRGDTLSLEMDVRNDGAGVLANATLYVPLPGGLDQWGAEVRVDGGPWDAYPANGLLALDPLDPGGERTYEIRADVELGAPGSLPTTAEILDSGGVLASAFVDANVLPSVDAGPDVIAEFGGSLVLSGSSAGDGGSGLAVIEWSDAGAGGSFDDPSDTNPSYTPPEVSGIIELTLRVVDHDGGEASDSLRVRVNAPPVADAGLDGFTNGGDVIDLSDASASDVDGWIVTHLWEDGGVGGTFDPSAGVLNPTYTVPEGSPCTERGIILTLTVADDWGGVAADARTLTIVRSNRAPAAEAGQDQTVTSGDIVLLEGGASDPDGALEAIRWDQLAGPSIGAIDAATETLAFEAPEVETETRLEFRLTATDACGDSGSDEVLVFIQPAFDPGSSTLDVTIDVLDSWGIPLSPLDEPSAGETLSVVVRIANSGNAQLTNVVGWSDLAGSLRFGGTDLGPWSRDRADFTVVVEPSLFGDRLSIDVEVSATAPDGTPVTGRAAILFLLGEGESDASLALEKTVDRTEAAIGEQVVYTYTIRNYGRAAASGLRLVDDRLGPIPLPEDRLDPGKTMTVSVPYTIRESDYPGPLTNTAVVTTYGETGSGTETAADLSIAILDGASGAGGAADFASGSAASTLARSVVISEIAWAGAQSDGDAEWIELVNLSDHPVDLDGWTLRWPSALADDGWQTIELVGTIDPLPVAITDRPDSLARLSAVPEGDGWRILDLTWWGVGKQGDEGRGYFLLERGSDGTVSDVSADLIYDVGFGAGQALPDAGTVLYLYAFDGSLVDTANGASKFGWVGGNARTGSTMERVNLLRGDLAENWQSSPGILTFGRDALGHRLLGTAGKPNAPSLETMSAFAVSKLSPTAIEAKTSLPIPSGGTSSTLQISVAGAGIGGSAGGGGSVLAAGSIRTRTANGEQWIDLDPVGWSAGIVCVWVAEAEGEAYVLVLAPGI